MSEGKPSEPGANNINESGGSRTEMQRPETLNYATTPPAERGSLIPRNDYVSLGGGLIAGILGMGSVMLLAMSSHPSNPELLNIVIAVTVCELVLGGIATVLSRKATFALGQMISFGLGCLLPFGMLLSVCRI